MTIKILNPYAMEYDIGASDIRTVRMLMEK